MLETERCFMNTFQESDYIDVKKLIFIVIIFLVVIGIIGCSMSESYGSEEAIKRGNIVYQNGVVNLERFE